jgi:3-isopropylmalate dehydrogenase
MVDFVALTQTIPGWSASSREKAEYTIGLLPGEGVGPEVIGVCLQVLETLGQGTPINFKLRTGGKIGLPAEQETGRVLTPEVLAFCQSIFEEGGAVLSGPAGGRFVYELRSHFDLFCKLVPLRPLAALADTGVVKADALKDVDILLVRENVGGIYFGQWEDGHGEHGLTASHFFEYRKDQVERILRTAVGLASARRGHLSLVLKSDGIPSISRLWIDVLKDVVKGSGLDFEILQVDNAAFHLIQAAQNFDVIVSTNLFGDILADCGGLLLGSRGMCFSGNFGRNRMAVYQTGHGAAYDLAGKDNANPIGQILSLVMLLRVSFDLTQLASRIEAAVEKTLREGWRTPDISAPGCKVVGTQELGRRICMGIKELS